MQSSLNCNFERGRGFHKEKKGLLLALILLLLITGTMPFLQKPVAVEVQEHAAAESCKSKSFKDFFDCAFLQQLFL
ncbi:hypothetical protein DQQ01_08490 [Blautia argi]|uniref:Uncharacterized protein n=1 Tax=Blautia argi TaxID=1912897 RepID=A0A2Z4UAZ7_9FIRM|nr:hypothetical protein DQQ01_08490 [Blautia argi]